MPGFTGLVATGRESALRRDRAQLWAWLEARGYQVIETGLNILAVHKADKGLGEIRISKAA
jgi:hypothetical protein